MLILFAFSTFFQSRFNVVKVIFNVGSTLKQHNFARWATDINCDLSSESPDSSTKELLYDLTQIISQPTRTTNTSKTLIDLCFANYPDKSKSIWNGFFGYISYHSLMFLFPTVMLLVPIFL